MNSETLIKIPAPIPLNLKLTLDCGQAFSWEENKSGFMCGVIGKSIMRVKQESNFLIFQENSESEIKNFLNYLDAFTDYEKICKKISKDETIKKAVDYFPGIRILKQEPFEALISFIISQNNNIPRIKGIIKRLREGFGLKIENGFYTFPMADDLAALNPEDLSPLRAGFRAKYIIDAAQKCTCGEIDFNEIKKAKLDDARNILMKIKGVGPKVADCTLLYGFHKTDAFPKDVWVKKILEKYYPNGLPDCIKGVSGIAQQYLFHYERNLKG